MKVCAKQCHVYEADRRSNEWQEFQLLKLGLSMEIIRCRRCLPFHRLNRMLRMQMRERLPSILPGFTTASKSMPGPRVSQLSEWWLCTSVVICHFEHFITRYFNACRCFQMKVRVSEYACSKRLFMIAASALRTMHEACMHAGEGGGCAFFSECFFSVFCCCL